MIKNGMICWISLFIGFAVMTTQAKNDFATQQFQAPRVRQAERLKKEKVEQLFAQQGVNAHQSELFLRAFKAEGVLEIWARPLNSKDSLRLITTYEICAFSGELGPKRKQGDGQVPEGLYHIDRFNAWSSYHLSLGINYPNASDHVRGKSSRLGGDIFIHGDCVTIGCLPMTDDKIREIYLMALYAKVAGQQQIPVHIFPFQMTEENLNFFQSTLHVKPETQQLWFELKAAWDDFEEHRQPPRFRILADGSYQLI